VDATLSATDRDRGVDELIELVGAVDGVPQAQAEADSDYFIAQGDFIAAQQQAIRDVMLEAYRWQGRLVREAAPGHDLEGAVPARRYRTRVIHVSDPSYAAAQ
jgi:hypothetical protein